MSWIHGRPGELNVVKFKGDIGSFLKRWAKLYPEYMDRSIRHVAYLAHMRLKTELLARVPGGKEFPQLSDIERFRRLGEKTKKGRRIPGPISAHGLAYNMNGGDWPPGGRLAQSIRYKWVKGSMHAEIGWLSPKTRKIGVLFQKGQKTLITRKMRALFYKAGILLSKGKKDLVQPARPVFEPFYANRKEWMYNRLIDRMRMHISNAAYDPTILNAKNVIFTSLGQIKRIR